MILVDTSIWIDLFRRGSNDHLQYLLDGESVVMHDFVLGEIAMGSLQSRRERLTMLRDLHRIPTASHEEVMVLVDSAELYSLGLTYIDVHLLAAARASSDVEPVRIWTRDKELHRQAERLAIAYAP